MTTPWAARVCRTTRSPWRIMALRAAWICESSKDLPMVAAAGSALGVAGRDIVVVPGWQRYAIRVDTDLVVFWYSERAAQEKLGWFREQWL